MVELPRPPVILDILREHLNELDSLWEQREGFIFSPVWTLRELAAHEERADAHLDGLRVGAGHAVEIARPVLTIEERGAATAATFVLMALDLPDLEREVLEALKTAPPKSRDGIRIGLRHSNVDRIAADLSAVAISAEPAVRAAALDVLAIHRIPPPKGMASLLGHADLEIRRLVYEAAGRFGGPWSRDVLEQALDCPSPVLKRAALRASARLGLVGLDETCRKAATRTQDPVPEALEFLGTLGNPKDLAVLQASLSRPGLAAAALAGMGKLGSVAAVPPLLEAMGDPGLAQAAGRAFVRMTAASRIESDVPSSPPPEQPTEVGAEIAEVSPPPDAAKARSWWEKEKGRFGVDGRWQSGHDLSREAIADLLDTLSLETHLDLLLGARARDPQGTQDRETESRAALQFGALSKGAHGASRRTGSS